MTPRERVLHRIRLKPGTLLRPAEVALLVGKHRHTVQNWGRSGRLRGYLTPGGQMRFPAAAVLDLIQREARMTLTEAAKFFEQHKAQYDDLGRKMKTAEAVLKDWFEANGKNKRGRIGFSLRMQKRLDITAVREYLGDDVVKFEKPSPSRSLFLID